MYRLIQSQLLFFVSFSFVNFLYSLIVICSFVVGKMSSVLLKVVCFSFVNILYSLIVICSCVVGKMSSALLKVVSSIYEDGYLVLDKLVLNLYLKLFLILFLFLYIPLLIVCIYWYNFNSLFLLVFLL